jgi:helix-turn-helix protein
MSNGEEQLADTPGRFMQVVSDGRKTGGADWETVRLLLSNKRLIVATGEGKKTIPLAKVASIKSRSDVNETVAKVSSYLSVQIGKDVYLISPKHQERFEEKLYGAILDQQVVFAKHPAVEGGVVQDTGWEKARLQLGEDAVELAIASGQFVEVDLDDVGTAETAERTVQGTERKVLEVEHAVDGTVVQTHISGPGRIVGVLSGLVSSGQEPADTDLGDAEHEVLMALYSGVSPFKIPDFVGMEVAEVEAIYDRLVEEGLLQEVRTRRNVSLKARGRNIASEVIDNQ